MMVFWPFCFNFVAPWRLFLRVRLAWRSSIRGRGRGVGEQEKIWWSVLPYLEAVGHFGSSCLLCTAREGCKRGLAATPHAHRRRADCAASQTCRGPQIGALGPQQPSLPFSFFFFDVIIFPPLLSLEKAHVKLLVLLGIVFLPVVRRSAHISWHSDAPSVVLMGPKGARVPSCQGWLLCAKGPKISGHAREESAGESDCLRGTENNWIDLKGTSVMMSFQANQLSG